MMDHFLQSAWVSKYETLDMEVKQNDRRRCIETFSRVTISVGTSSIIVINVVIF